MRSFWIKSIVIMAVALAAVGFTMRTDAYAKDADGDYVVIIDPGHGSGDPGAPSLGGGYEATFNWNISVALKAELETYAGVKVYLTRGSAEPFSNSGRGHFGENLGADLAISVHNNSGGAGSRSGIMCFGTVDSKNKSKVQSLCYYIAAEVAPYVGFGTSDKGYTNRASDFVDGSSQVNFYTFIDEATKAGIPALIIEHCFLDHPSNSAFINITANQYKLGYADATGIAKYLGLSKRTVAAGGSVNLIRTYSAKFTGVTGTFKSSNESVAKVGSNGTITAVGAGKAEITCTAADGSVSSVSVTVPAVKMVGIAAGITPTMYRTYEEYLNINKGMTTVKAIYSDGSAVQVSGASIGTPVVGQTKTYTYPSGEAPNVVTDINTPVSYGGFSCTLKNYYGPKLTLGNYTKENYMPSGANKDILHIPAGYTSVAGSTIPDPTPPQTVAPPATTQASTQATTEMSTENVTEGTTAHSSQATTEASSADIPASGKPGGISDAIPVLVALIAVLSVGLVGGIWLAIRRR